MLLSFIIIHTAFPAEQVITIGNVINITVLGYPELSKTVVVRQDGTTDYPLLANVPVEGLTLTEFKELLFPILVRYVERPRLFVNISEHFMLQVRVQGEVKNPGPYQVQGPIDLQGVISVAGGLLNTSDLRNIRILRRIKEQKVSITIDLYEYLKDEQAAKLPEINDGDIIIVPMLSLVSYVRVLGAVQSPGNYVPRDKNTNVVDIINQAGGITVNGNLNHVYYIPYDRTEYVPKRIKVRKLWSSGRITEIPIVHPGDIVIVNEYSPWNKLTFWAQIMQYAAWLLSSIVILMQI